MTEQIELSHYVLTPLWCVMSYWEQNWRKNLKLITVDEIPPSQQLRYPDG